MDYARGLLAGMLCMGIVWWLVELPEKEKENWRPFESLPDHRRAEFVRLQMIDPHEAPLHVVREVEGALVERANYIHETLKAREERRADAFSRVAALQRSTAEK